MTKRKKRNVGGFTLAELMVVIVIIGLLATLVVPNIVGKIFTAKVGIAKTQVSNIEAAVEDYQIRNSGKLPDSLEALVTPDPNGVTYLKNATAVPLDPWGNQYFYRPDSNGMTFEIGTYGSDGQPGGEGDAADISNKTLANEMATKKGN